MKITICGSNAFSDAMLKTKKELESLGHEVKMPPTEVEDEFGKMIPVTDFYSRRKKAGPGELWIWERKKQAMFWHFEKVAWAEAVLVLNYDKNGIANYVGPNTLMEMGLALYLSKKIFLLNPIPEINYKEEILGMMPIVINNDLSKIQ